MTKKDAVAAILNTVAYIVASGGEPDDENGGSVTYQIETDHGPASVSLFPSADGKGPPWLALRYRDMVSVKSGMDSGRLSRDVNPFSGKFNCRILDDGRTAGEVANAFRQHLSMAGFPAGRRDEEGERIAAFVKRWWNESSETQPAGLIVEAPAATQNGKD